MLAAAGMSPLVITESPPQGASDTGAPAGGTAAPAWDSDDPFAPSADDPYAAVAAEPPSHAADTGRAPGAEEEAQPSASGGGSDQGGGGQRWSVRSEWTDSERLLLREYGCALLAAVEEVFGLEAVAGDPGELELLAQELLKQEVAAAEGAERRGEGAVDTAEAR